MSDESNQPSAETPVTENAPASPPDSTVVSEAPAVTETPAEPAAVEPPAPVVETQPETPVAAPAAPAATPEPAPTLDTQPDPAPNVAGPLPKTVAFSGSGAPELPRAIEPASAAFTRYIDKAGASFPAEVVVQRADGSLDILVKTADVTYRRDAVRPKESADQTGDFIE
jgi:hypothetical protein